MKNVIIAIILLIVLPTAVLFGMYTFYEPFTDIVNTTLAKVPGNFGGYFRSIPTEQDDAVQLTTIAGYLLDLDPQQAVDKLKLIENEDSGTYDNVVKSMIRLNPSRSERILEEKRRQSLKPNVIQSTLEQIGEEQAESNKEKASVIEGLPLAARLETVKRILDERVDAHNYLASLIVLMEPSTFGDLMPYLGDKDLQKIKAALDETTRLNLENYVAQKNQDQANLFQTAQILAGKPLDELSATLGSTETYSLDELVSLYQSLGPKRAGVVLSKIDNDTFAFELVNAIKAQQILNTGQDKFTGDLLKALNIFKAYDDNINELVGIYNQLEESKTADILRRLYWNTGQVKRYNLANGEEIMLSDQQLALDILKSFPPKKVASILSYLDNIISTEISTKLALPTLE